jgi:hypothetical protein
MDSDGPGADVALGFSFKGIVLPLDFDMLYD